MDVLNAFQVLLFVLSVIKKIGKLKKIVHPLQIHLNMAQMMVLRVCKITSKKVMMQRVLSKPLSTAQKYK